MNNKGFTLIELLIIIGIFALIGGLFSVNMTRILNKTNETNEVEANSELISAADVFFAINKERIAPLYNGDSKIEVSIKELKKSGLINKDYAINGNIVSDDTRIFARLGDQGELVFSVEMSDD